jgi:DNA-binding SARP family transcriptional activator
VIVCHTLGPVSIEVDGAGAPSELTWRKNIALVVYLARSPKRARAREHLIGLLWGDKPEEKARHSLNEAVRVLRRYAGEGGVDSDATQVRFHADAVELDTDRFEALVAAGDYRGAAALVAGEFLEGFSVPGASSFDDWMTAERAHWRQRSVEVLIRCAEQLLAAGALTGATETARRALALDPLSDAAARAVMRCLALAGDRAGALEQGEIFARRLKAEVGTEPALETRALAERMRHERMWRLPQHLGGAPAEARRAPLVGRAVELERLVESWAACRRERRAAVAVVEGDAGLGKTRLAEELAARARLDGAVVAAVRAVEADRSDAWSGVLGLTRGGLLDAPGVAAAPPSALAQLRAGAPAETSGRALSDVLQAVADEQPVLVFADDVHWLDRESLLALGAAARDLARAPRDELDELRVRIGRELAGCAVRLGPVAPDALRALAHWALPAYGKVEIDRVARRVATDSAGIPLLAVELLQAVASGLDLRETGGAWPEPLRTLDQTLPGDLPDAIVAAVRINFRRLSADAQRVLASAAVLGGRVNGSTLGRASGVAHPALAAALDELEWQRWLTAEPRGYTFVARIVRDVVDRDMVTPGQRQRIKEATGEGFTAP